MTKLMLALAAFAFSATSALAEGGPLNADGLKWGNVPPGIPRGAQFAVVSGNPGGDGLYVIRLKMPANYRIPAHHHPTDEYVTVLSGNFHIGMGDKLDPASGQELRTGGFAQAPAGMNHYAWTTSDTVIQVHGQGPFAITYVNPADDPRNAQ